MRFQEHGHPHDHRHHAGPHGFGRGGRGGRHGGWGEGDEGQGSAGRGGRRRRVFDQGELRLVLLKLIADQPRHGYELIRAIEELSGGLYVPSPGVVYPTLTMLHEMAQIEEAASGGARKAFAITPDGTAYLDSKKAEVDALFARLAALATARERTDGGPIRRAMQNLKMVLINRLERDDLPAETVHQAAAILDEAAQKIERLEDRARPSEAKAPSAERNDVSSVVQVPTAHASRYLQQLCKHWSHNLTVTFDEANGTVTFPKDARGADWPGDGTLTMSARDDGLDCHLEASTREQLEALKGALSRHLDRFAFREAPLPFDWHDE